jgi:N-acetylglucosamine kinase-like BadF-type ATPase
LTFGLGIDGGGTLTDAAVHTDGAISAAAHDTYR